MRRWARIQSASCVNPGCIGCVISSTVPLLLSVAYPGHGFPTKCLTSRLFASATALLPNKLLFMHSLTAAVGSITIALKLTDDAMVSKIADVPLSQKSQGGSDFRKQRESQKWYLGKDTSRPLSHPHRRWKEPPSR